MHKNSFKCLLQLLSFSWLVIFCLEGSYHHPLAIEQDAWDNLKPYFLPSKHRLKPILDELFDSRSTIANREGLIAAGFTLGPPKQPGNLVVGKHPRLKGYLVKIYLENQDNCEWDNFFKRVTGAESIQNCIQKYGYQKLFQVPKKWVYPLPFDPLDSAQTSPFPKHFILVVEDMQLINSHENGKAFQRRITTETLDALYVLIEELGLIDSVFKGNIPFNKAGKICFIDTEHHHLWPVNYSLLNRYLSAENRTYWQSITNQ